MEDKVSRKRRLNPFAFLLRMFKTVSNRLNLFVIFGKLFETDLARFKLFEV